ncbi:MAG: DUF3857 domain-containing protein [Pseudomonadota bacterium]
MPRHLTHLILAIFSLILAWGPCALAATDQATYQTKPFSYSLAPVPAGIQPPQAYGDPRRGQADRGMRYLLVDRQVVLLDKNPRQFLRLVFQVGDAQTIKQASQLVVVFNPEYQKLELHGVRVIRDGKTMDRTREVKFELLQREANLERQSYDGEVSAVAILPDIRVNDIIEFERSVVGGNPIFQGRYAEVFAITGPYSTDNFRQVLLHPADRQIAMRNSLKLNEVVERKDGVVSRTLQARNLKPMADERDRPRWFDPFERVEISEYPDWKTVDHWAQGLFEVDTRLPTELQNMLSGWQARGHSQEQLAMEALRWVQREIRYFGIEIGVNSHLPAQPALVHERRFGDCKDKSLLLTVMLRTLGIPARPALVSVSRHRSVADMLPSPAVFDHVITRVELNGRVYWLDPALPPQYGNLAELGMMDYGKALVVGNQQDMLVDAGLPAGYLAGMEATDRYEVRDYREPASLVSELTLTGELADQYRTILASLPLAESSRIFHSEYLRLMPNAQPQGEIEIRDDQDHNRITLVRRFLLPDLFKYERGRLTLEALSPLALDLLRSPEVPSRKTPYSLPFPMKAVIRQIVALPDNPVRDAPPPNVDRTAYVTVQSSFRTGPRELARELQIQTHKDHVPANAMAGYVEDLQRLRQKGGLTVNLRTAPLSEADKRGLNDRLSRFDQFGNSQAPGVRAQIQSEVGVVQYAMDIASGKLNSSQLALAHGELAIDYDNLEKHDPALVHIDQAIALAPDQVQYKLTKARVLSSAGRFGESVALFDALDKEGHRHAMGDDDLGAWGRSLFYLGRYPEATRLFDEAARQRDVTAALYMQFWQHLADRRAQSQASGKLAEHLITADRNTWPYPIGEALLGRITPQQLLTAARHEDKGVQRDQMAEAHFYLAQKHLLDGDVERARDHLDNCIEQNATPFLEHFMAREELKRLGGGSGGLMRWLKNL